MIVALFLGFVFIFLFCLFDDYFSWQYYLYQHSMTLKMTDPVSLNSSSFLKQSTGPHQGACLSTAWTDLGSIPLSTLDEPLELCKTLGMWVHWLRVSGSFSSQTSQITLCSGRISSAIELRSLCDCARLSVRPTINSVADIASHRNRPYLQQSYMEHVFAITMTAVSSLQPLTHPCDTSTTREKAGVCLHALCHIIVLYYLIYIKQFKHL